MRRTRKISTLFVWLALIAIGLTVVAPVISRTVAAVAASTPHAVHHDMDMSMQTPAGHEHAHGPAPQQAHQHDSGHADHDGMLMEDCGYCGLLGHSPLLFVIAWLPNVLPPARPQRLVPPTLRGGPERSTLTAAPRGPPAFPYC